MNPDQQKHLGEGLRHRLAWDLAVYRARLGLYVDRANFALHATEFQLDTYRHQLQQVRDALNAHPRDPDSQ